MRQIKASEVKPGMTIRWKRSGITRECEVAEVTTVIVGLTVRSPEGGETYIGIDTEVTVLAEPAPPQPEEPRWIAARAKLRDYRFFRVDESDRPWRKADCMGRISPCRYSWSDVCSLGPVTVIPDQGWTVPDDTPEVPERIEEWPEDDTALRPYPWRDDDGDLWWSVSSSRNPWVVRFADRTAAFHPHPKRGPWTRVTDA